MKIKGIATQYEPKRINGFSIIFPENSHLENWSVETISKPKFKNTIIPFISKWEDVEITFIDMIGPSVSQTLFKIKNMKDFTIILNALDPVMEIVEEWVIKVDKIKFIDFGNCNRANNNLQIIKLILKVKDCKLSY